MSFLHNLYFFQGQKYTSFGKNILLRQSTSLGHSSTGHPVLNTFSLWGPHEALKIILRNKKYLQHCNTARNTSLMKLLLLLSSSIKINNEDVQKLLICQNRNAPVPKSQYLIQMLKYLPHASHHDDSIENFDHLLELLLFLQTPSVKTRLLFDIFDLNSDRFLSQKEITTILESAINQTGIKVKRY